MPDGSVSNKYEAMFTRVLCRSVVVAHIAFT